MDQFVFMSCRLTVPRLNHLINLVNAWSLNSLQHANGVVLDDMFLCFVGDLIEPIFDGGGGDGNGGGGGDGNGGGGGGGNGGGGAGENFDNANEFLVDDEIGNLQEDEEEEEEAVQEDVEEAVQEDVEDDVQDDVQEDDVQEEHEEQEPVLPVYVCTQKSKRRKISARDFAF